MNCRRCQSLRLLTLEKRIPEDNDIYRCRDCGFLFSPGGATDSGPASGPVTVNGASAHAASGPSRTTAMQSGYPGGL